MKKIISMLLVVAMLVSTMGFSMTVRAEETVTAQGTGFTNIPFDGGYTGYCIDRSMDGANVGKTYFVADNTTAAKNNVTNEDISQNLKILFTQCFKDLFVKTEDGDYILDESVRDGDLPLAIYHYTGEQDYVWDGNKKLVEKVTAYSGPDIPDNGYQIMYNDDVITFDFIVLEPVTGEGQSFFAYKLSVEQRMEQTVQINVNKTWNDEDDQDGIRPESVTVRLLADGKETGKTLVLNKANNWAGTFSDLDEKASGRTVEYTIEEVKVDGYTTTISGNVTEGFVITNTYTPTPTVPEEPDKPDVPDKPEESDKSESVDESQTNVPDTGDYSNVGMWLALFGSSLLGMFGVVTYRKRKK